jgi:MoxR-like ATPase
MLPRRFSLMGELMQNKLKRHGLLSLFVLTLSLSILLGTFAPLWSQSVLPSSPLPPALQGCSVPEDLCKRIKERAKKDVEAETKESEGRNFVITTFKTEHRGWKDKISEKEANNIQRSIADTYEWEFERLSDIRKRDPQVALKKIFENGLWVPSILAVLGIVFAWFRDGIGKAWTTFAQKITDWVYSRFAGTPLFESVALQRYREALVENYQHLKIPFRVNHAPLEMSEIYVPLKVAGTSDSDQVDAFGAIAQHRRLMITGIPGSGKTMLLRHIAFSYGKGRLPGLENRPVPILLELHRLSDPELTEEKLIAAIVEAFKRNRFPKAERFVQESLKQGKLMLLLDGLDEVNSGIRPVLVQHIGDLLRSMDEHQRCRLIVTCRTAVYENEFANETDQTLEVVEFTDQQMRRFLDAWQRVIPAGKSIEQLMQTLRDRPRIMVLARNPLLLTIIAHLYTDPSFEFPRSRTEFYQESTRILLEQWQKDHNKYKGIAKRRILQQLALRQQLASTQQQQDRRSIDYSVVLEQIGQHLPNLDLKDEDKTPLLEELVGRSGLLLKIDGGARYQFAHLTLQEYFAAEALADKPNDLIQYFRQDPTTWREVVKLWCGIAGDSTVLIKEICQQDVILGFECLADAQEVDQQTAESLIEHCKELLGGTGEQDTLTKAFGAVAASDRPRGQAVFQFLQTALDQPTESYRHGEIAQALSFTNRPQAAKVLAIRYDDMSNIVRQSLVRMGDLAVPALAQLAYQGIQFAIDDLYEVGTSDAAEALVPMLWSRRHGKVVMTAAWYLASLLLQSRVEEALKIYDLRRLGDNRIPSDQLPVQDFNYVWEPFQDRPNVAMITIIGRIASVITSGLSNYPVENSLLTFDFRLVVPILAIQRSTILAIQPNTIFIHPLSKWNLEQIDTLLEQRENTDQLNQKIIQLVNTIFAEANQEEGWRFLLNGIPPRLQLDLLRSLVTATRSPTRDDWINLFQSVKYEFKTSRHYRGILLIAALLSFVAGCGLWQTAAKYPIGAVTGVVGFAVVVIGVFWWTLAKGVEDPWEPNLFIKLGVLGVQTYVAELHQLFQNRLIWPGIKVIHEILDEKNTFAVPIVILLAIAFYIALTFNITFPVTFVVAITFSVALSIVIAFFATSLMAFIGNSVSNAALSIFSGVLASTAGFFFNTRAIVFVGTTAPATGALIVAMAACGISIFAGLGLGSWNYFENEQKKGWQKLLPALALPWFCTAPIVVFFAGVALTSLFTPLTFLPVQPWQSAGLLELFIVGASIGLWHRGQKLDAMARNPLQGGLIEETLRVKYGRPRTSR